MGRPLSIHFFYHAAHVSFTILICILFNIYIKILIFLTTPLIWLFSLLPEYTYLCSHSKFQTGHVLTNINVLQMPPPSSSLPSYICFPMTSPPPPSHLWLCHLVPCSRSQLLAWFTSVITRCVTAALIGHCRHRARSPLSLTLPTSIAGETVVTNTTNGFLSLSLDMFLCDVSGVKSDAVARSHWEDGHQWQGLPPQFLVPSPP